VNHQQILTAQRRLEFSHAPWLDSFCILLVGHLIREQIGDRDEKYVTANAITLATKLRLSPKTVQRTTKKLEKHGCLIVIRKSNRANRYQVIMEAVPFGEIPRQDREAPLLPETVTAFVDELYTRWDNHRRHSSKKVFNNSKKFAAAWKQQRARKIARLAAKHGEKKVFDVFRMIAKMCHTAFTRDPAEIARRFEDFLVVYNDTAKSELTFEQHTEAFIIALESQMANHTKELAKHRRRQFEAHLRTQRHEQQVQADFNFLVGRAPAL
jgi:uncharacterized protein YceH (UPF0502 family)